nr:hypothetical protein [Pseudonocardia sp. AL041005-10]
MADHEFFGTVSVSDPPAASDHLIRLLELQAAQTADRARANHTGTQSADTLTDGSSKVAMTTAERTKLSSVASGATANASDAALRARSSHTGTQSADTLTDGTTNVAMLATERTKLSGIATGATANDTDTNLRNRANHTGTQPASTISDFTAQVNALIQNVIGAAPAALDTLVELAQALGNDPNFAGTITSQISGVSSRVTTLENSQGASNSFKTNVGDGSASTFTVTHNKNTLDVDVLVRRVSDGQRVFPVDKAASANTVTLDFGTTVPATNAYRVIVTPR